MSADGDAVWEDLVWDVTAFHPAASSAASAHEFLSSACVALEQAASGTGRPLLSAYCNALGDVSSMLGLDAVVREVSAPDVAAGWARTTEPVVLRSQAAIEALQHALARSAEGLLPGASALEAAFLRHLIEGRLHRPPDAAAPWATLARRVAFERLGELHVRHSKGALVAEFSVGATIVSVRRSNLRALLSSPDHSVRHAVWAFRRVVAVEAKPILAGINELRAQYRTEEARLLGYGDVLEAACAEFRIAPSTYRSLSVQRANVRAFADRFFRWKRDRLGIASLEEADVAAQIRVPGSGWLEFGKVVGSLERCVERFHPEFPGVLRELKDERAFLTDSRATFSSAWFTISHYGGRTPLVHVPYHRTIDDFCAAAHELGHACHKTVVARELGPLAASDEGFCYSELFALAFEIAAVHQALDQAANDDERDFWRGVALEQAAHFLRTLPIRSRFDELTYLEATPADEAWALAHAELSPDWLPGPTPGDATWALSTSSEDLPFQGQAYALAFLVAYLGYLQPERGLVPRLLSDGPWLPFEGACTTAAAIDVADPTTFDPVWEHLRRLSS